MTTNDTRQLGVVAWWHATRDFGFITLDGGGREDLFFHATAARTKAGEYVRFERGERVVCVEGLDRFGKRAATWVRRAADEQEAA